MLTVDDIVSKVKAYNNHASVDLIRKSYEFSARAHQGQKRLSGQPYVLHPLEVANTLAEMRLDPSSIIAGMLHDTLEDTQSTKDEIQQIFGPEVAELVDGVTKLSKLHFITREDRQAENFRKMIIAMSRDIRVILIKLADRLNNMKTLQYMTEEKQMTISRETLDIYSPLARRLGIQWMKIQLEDLSLRFLKPDIYRQIEKKIARLKKSRDEYTQRVKMELERAFKGSVELYEISGRIKHIYGIYEKMERQNISFEQVHDILGIRILTQSVEKCYEILGLLHSLWKPVPGRFKDYVAMPKENNYQSLHTTVICLDGERVEFQIRTFDMHEVAEKGIASHWKYKEDGQLDLKSEATFNWLRQLMDWQNELKDSIEFMDTVKLDLFASDIYVFTPKGDLRALPHGAGPIDFAYSIHSDVGHHCAGARVNGKIVPLTYKLESGDEVEIFRHPDSAPTKDWLKMVVGPRAKAKIRQFLKQEQREKSIKLGEHLFEQECKKIEVKPETVRTQKSFKEMIEKRGIVGEASFYSAVAYGKILLPDLLSHVIPEKAGKASEGSKGVIRDIFRKASLQTKDLVLIDGIEDILITFGKCCFPVQGDPIVGFVTRGRGVTLHRVDCPRVPDIDAARRVNAEWNYHIEANRISRLRIACESKTGMLANIAQNISERNVNITKASVRTTRDEKAVIIMDIGIKSLNELHTVIKAVEKIDGVISVERELG